MVCILFVTMYVGFSSKVPLLARESHSPSKCDSRMQAEAQLFVFVVLPPVVVLLPVMIPDAPGSDELNRALK
jgi:hypothetical protein